MWELICHHTYKLEGLPVDLSMYESNGERQAADFLPDGVAPGSGALRFQQPQSRVRIPADAGSPWQTLGGVRIEATARVLAQVGHWQTLVAADGAFKFFFRDAHLIAEFSVAPGTSTLPWSFSGVDHDGLSTAEYGAGFAPFEHRVNAWRTFGFAHDGIDSVELTVDGDVVARRRGLAAGIRGVGAAGVHIGNAPGNAGHCLEGDVDEVRIWRLDPNAMKRAFLSRPFDDASAECWTRIFRAMGDALARDPECAQRLAAEIPAVFDRIHRAIVQSSSSARERFALLRAEYARLWSFGQFEGPAMAAVLAELCALLRAAGISPTDDPEVRALLTSPCMMMLRDACKGLDLECDPKGQALARAIAEASNAIPAAP